MDWLKHPTVAERYAAFRASLHLKPVDNTFGLRAGEADTLPEPPEKPTGNAGRGRALNGSRRKTD